MDLNNIPIMTALRKHMHWLNKNQTVLSENVSHADTPGYKAKGLEKQDFSDLVDALESGPGKKGGSVAMRATKAGHMGFAGASGDAKVVEVKGEESPTGNSVTLEEELIKVADNQMKYGMVVNLYKKNMGLLKTALGRNQ